MYLNPAKFKSLKLPIVSSQANNQAKSKQSKTVARM